MLDMVPAVTRHVERRLKAAVALELLGTFEQHRLQRERTGQDRRRLAAASGRQIASRSFGRAAAGGAG